MHKILFVCHGNICRSPMAEFVMKKMVCDSNLSSQFLIESAATSTEEIGNPVYPPARKILELHGISCKGKTARQITCSDFDFFDHIVAMDSNNLRNLERVFGQDKMNKVSLLMDYTNNKHDVADPWYTDDFETTWNDVYEGCCCLLSKLLQQHVL